MPSSLDARRSRSARGETAWRILANEDDVRRGELALHVLGPIPDDDRDRAGSKLACRCQNVGGKRPRRKAVQNLGQCGMHALALTSGEHHDVERGGHLPKRELRGEAMIRQRSRGFPVGTPGAPL